MSFSNWPPGIIFILGLFPPNAPPLILVLIAQKLSPFLLPYYFWVSAYILAIPTTKVVQSYLQRLSEDREIVKFGAKRAPRVPFRLPGGIEILQRIEHTIAHGYLCEPQF